MTRVGSLMAAAVRAAAALLDARAGAGSVLGLAGESESSKTAPSSRRADVATQTFVAPRDPDPDDFPETPIRRSLPAGRCTKAPT
jgi:hypothetical protein